MVYKKDRARWHELFKMQAAGTLLTSTWCFQEERLVFQRVHDSESEVPFLDLDIFCLRA